MDKANMHEIYSLLNKIEKIDHEIAEFLCQHGYGDRPDIVDPEKSLIKAGVLLTYDFNAARDVLQKVVIEQAEEGHPETSMSVLVLLRRLGKLGEEISGQNKQ